LPNRPIVLLDYDQRTIRRVPVPRAWHLADIHGWLADGSGIVLWQAPPTEDAPSLDPARQPVRSPVDPSVVFLESISPDGHRAMVDGEDTLECPSQGLLEIETGAAWWADCGDPVPSTWIRP
jgi:hypothetical protein